MKTLEEKILIDLNQEPQQKESEFKIPEGYEIIDLRTPGQAEKYTLQNAIKIPFKVAWDEFIHWDKNKKYYLVCDEGSTSATLAEYMKREGFTVEHLAGGYETIVIQ